MTEAHTPLIVESGFKGKSSHGDYGDTILQMDAMVGKVLDMLDSSGQAENTLVYYTSDHGGHIDRTGTLYSVHPMDSYWRL